MLVCVVLSCLCLVALWSPAGKGLTSWLSCLLFLSLSQLCPGPYQNKGRSWRRETGLSPPEKYFTDHSKAVLLLWIFFFLSLSCVCYAFVRVCLFVPCGHLLGKGWPLGSRLWCITVSLSLSHWYPGSGVVFDCIDS